EHDGRPLIQSGRFAFLMLLGVDAMFWVGLMGGYFVLRGGTNIWPPVGAIVPNAVLGWIATASILASSILFFLGRKNSRPFLISAYLLSLCFSTIVGLELFRLTQSGLDLRSVYGGIVALVLLCIFIHGISTFVISLLEGKHRLSEKSRQLTYLQAGVW